MNISNRTRRIHPFFTIALCVFAKPGGAQIPAKPAPYTPPKLIETISYSLDSVAISAGIPILRKTFLPEGVREIRLWTHGWYYDSGRLYRIIIRDRSVSGEVITHWPLNRRVAPSSDTIPLSVRRTCGNFTSRAGYTTCRDLFDRTPPWRDALRMAEAAGVWEIPDQSEPGHPVNTVTDGWGMFVELRDGNRYRAYSYSNPSYRSGHRDFQRATAVVAAFRLIKEAMSRRKDGVAHRGLYIVGAGLNEFTPCGSERPLPVEGLPELKPTVVTRMYVEFEASYNVPWVTLNFRPQFIIRADSVIVIRPWTPDACAR